MPDDKTKRHPHDGKRIDINDPYEIKNWCKILDISKEELIYLVSKHGTSSDYIRSILYLHNNLGKK